MNKSDREEYEPPVVTDIEPVTVFVRGGEGSILTLDDC